MSRESALDPMDNESFTLSVYGLLQGAIGDKQARKACDELMLYMVKHYSGGGKDAPGIVLDGGALKFIMLRRAS